MKVSASWISEYLVSGHLLSASKIVDALELAGLEIEAVDLRKSLDPKIVVGQITAVKQHPQADRLKLVEVDFGKGFVHVVCGAPNVREQMKVALAQVGTRLPGGDVINQATLRGEASNGMLCSEFELAVGEDHSGIIELPAESKLGSQVAALYPEDAIIDLKTPANRFDLLSVIGLAREVAAMTGIKLNLPKLAAAEIKDPDGVLGSHVDSSKYMIARLKLGGQISTSPDMVAKLLVEGQRSINMLVDITNYVMFEFGQPMHAFDASKVTLPLSVRSAKSGELLTTLDGIERKLVAEDLVIADAKGPIALAGVMGGLHTEVSEQTREVLLEAAVFDPVRVRKSAKRHGLRTEASARLERGLPLELPVAGMARAIDLLRPCIGSNEVLVVANSRDTDGKRSITLEMSVLSKIAGIDIKANRAKEALQALQIEATLEQSSGGERLHVSSVPWWRPDIKVYEDLIEEILRVIGYDVIPATLPGWRPSSVSFDRERAKLRKVRDVLYAAGAFEVKTYSFVSADQIKLQGLKVSEHLKLLNPLTNEQEYLRSSMLASQLAVVSRNRKFAREFTVYEVSKVFKKRGKAEQPDEPEMLAITVVGGKQSVMQLKGILDAISSSLNERLVVQPSEKSEFALGRYGEISLRGNKIGYIGQVHPAIAGELKIDSEVSFLELQIKEMIKAAGEVHAAALQKYPTITRDVTVLLPNEVTWQSLAESLKSENASYRDEYRGKDIPEGRRALTLRLVVQNEERTPTDAEADQVAARVIEKLVSKFHATVRQQ